MTDHRITVPEGESLAPQAGIGLLPLPYTYEAVRHVVSRIHQVQECLARRILIENVSSYLEFECAEMSEAMFVEEVASAA